MSTGSTDASAASRETLRAEHDALAQRLGSRHSIDFARRGAYIGFIGIISAGLSIKFAFDRWFSTRLTRFKGPPIWFFSALGLTLVLLTIAVISFQRSRKLMREEDILFARMKKLRQALELDP